MGWGGFVGKVIVGWLGQWRGRRISVLPSTLRYGAVGEWEAHPRSCGGDRFPLWQEMEGKVCAKKHLEKQGTLLFLEWESQWPQGLCARGEVPHSRV